MAEKTSMQKWIIILLAIIVIVGVVAYLYTQGLFIFPGKQQVTYSGEKTIVQSAETGIEMYPSNGEVIRGLMTIKLTKAPANTAEVWFGFVPRNQYSDTTDTNLGFDPDGGNGWSLDFNTKDIINGEYTVFIVPRDANKDPIDRIFANVIVQH